ncbi:MAG TPA: galactokinase [Telluria sp.]
MNAEMFFGGAPEASASAPGRVNLLGEHTDYNDGYMLPLATPQRTEVALARSNDGHFHFYSATLDSHVTFAQDGSAPIGFGSYIEGCIRLVQARGIDVPPLRVFCQTNLAVGSGLSSSAALEVATLRALRSLLDFPLDDVELAQIAQRAEIEFAHVNCGIMDQMASSLADTDTMLFIDARTLEHRLVPLPEGTALIVIDTGVARKLAASKYNERRSECQEAARLLGATALRDVTDLAAVEALPEPMRRRARHVVSENLRVLEAIEGIDGVRFGELMNQCHFSLRDDYEVSIPELDHLAQALRDQEGVLGARMTGAGFGGACVALCRTELAEQAAIAALDAYDNNPINGARGRLLIPVPRA